MNLDNIIEFLKLLGIKMTVDNNRMLFYDSETNERIESYYNTAPLPFYANDVWDHDITLDKVLKIGRVHLIAKDKVLAFGLTYPIINRRCIDTIIISKMDFSILEDEKVINRCSVEFKEGRSPSVEIISRKSEDEEYKMTLYSSGDIRFKTNAGVGFFIETFDEGYGLSKDEMVEVLNNTFLLEDIVDYYSSLFPNIRASVEQAKQAKTI